MDFKVARQVESFFSQFPLKQFKKGQILIYKGDAPLGVHYLAHGNVRQYDITETGIEVVANVFKPPAFFPMSWVINRGKNTYFFETTSDVSLHLAPADETDTFVKNNPEVMYDLLSRLYSGVDGLQRRMVYLMGSSARTRLIYELIISCRRFGVKDDTGGCTVTTTGAELASQAGLSRETVSRELQQFEKEGLIEVGYKEVQIKKLSRLEGEIEGDI